MIATQKIMTKIQAVKAGLLDINQMQDALLASKDQIREWRKLEGMPAIPITNSKGKVAYWFYDLKKVQAWFRGEI